MTEKTETVRKEIINKIISIVNKQLPKSQAKLLSDFTPQYFGNIPLDDLDSRPIVDLYGALISHWGLMEQRKPAELKINVYNPHFEQHGWQSTHTIIEVSYDDMPFLTDSLRMEINRLGFTTHLTINLGGIKLCRNAAGNITSILSNSASEPGMIAEAAVHMEIDRQTDPHVLENIRENLERVVNDVTFVVNDWEKMREQVFHALEELDKSSIPIAAEEIEESKAFLRWLVNDHFTFLGYRAYDVVGTGESLALRLVPKTGLGVLHDESTSKILRYFNELPPQARDLVLSPHILIISKTNTKSTVHRPPFTDSIGVKLFDEKGKITGVWLFIGLYTSDAYNSNPKHIPFLRLKVETVLQMSNLPRNGHAAKTLRNILETLPRDDLFQASPEELYEMAMGILHLQERRRIRLFVRKDAYDRFYSCYVYLPRDSFNTELLNRMRDILKSAFHGTEVTLSTHFSESVLARINYVVRVDPKKQQQFDLKMIEHQLEEAGRSWQDDLRDKLLEYFGEETGNELVTRYLRAFPAGYRESFTPRAAIYDIEHIEQLSVENDLGMSFYRHIFTSGDTTIHFKLFHPETTIPLSDALPMLENMGLRVMGEQSYEILLQDRPCVWVNDFNMIYPPDNQLNVENNRELFQDAFYKIWRGEVENDGFNRLVLRAHLSWREITLFRAYAKYFRQTGFTFSQQYIEETLFNNPTVVILLLELFKLRFDPKNKAEDQTIAILIKDIEKALDSVVNLDQDRILRRYLALIHATLRTNFFQTDLQGQPKSYLSFKFDPKHIPDLPLPLPMFEIFVYSARFEGIHLRAGKVARGGIRWSDRREDFRTEVLGLMKAQQVKNAVIVPSGAKGGFIPKSLPLEGSREAIMEEAIACYRNYIRGLLDITDNLVNGDVIHPKDTVIYDSEDPYLVVAADKGTASFSDIANAIAKEYGFWLGDAFASGGSTGYDHKKMAITSRGAWESVQNHFQMLGFNINLYPFTVIGIGDMSGDVFGNGMLLSENIRLVGAFNHMHIFLDPNPNTQLSFAERKRLFNLPRSSWDDYDVKLISKGGGVFKRLAKSIALSPEVQKALDFHQDTVEPGELIRALLKAPVDLIWNGGIGTYVKATYETNNEVGDRANDAIRINGDQLRSRVVGEGGNLGWTQLGRIEYEFSSGKINTDFIDNSGGVDCSDHEVNIKILLNSSVIKGEMTEQQRNLLLAEMTEEVADLVLKNNYRQVRAISLAADQSQDYLNLYRSYITDQEAAGKINRQLEYLPDDKTLNERKIAGKGMTRPELSVLLAYSKIILKEEILASEELLNDPYLSHYIDYAFPKRLVENFPLQLKQHHLRHEIIATQLSNAVVTDMGITFVYQMHDETSASTATIVQAYAIMQAAFNMTALRESIDALDNKVDPLIQIEMTEDIVRLVRRSTRWLLRNRRPPFDIQATIEYFSTHILELYQHLPKIFVGAEKQSFAAKKQELMEEQVPEETALIVAASRHIYSALNIIQAATESQSNIDEVAVIYFTLADPLDLVWFREVINNFPVDNHWTVLARATFKADLDAAQRALTISVLQQTSTSKDASSRVNAWFELHRPLIERWKSIIASLKAVAPIDSAMLSVAIRVLQELAELSAVKAADEVIA